MKNTFCIKLGGFNFNIETLYSYTLELCRGYLADGDSKVTAVITDPLSPISEADIEYEWVQSFKEVLYELLLSRRFVSNCRYIIALTWIA